MINYDEAVKEGMRVTGYVAADFFKKNTSVYQRLGLDVEDVVSYLYGTVLVKKYLKLVEEKPDFYPSIKNFTASLTTACKNSLFTMHQAQVGTQKRGDMLRSEIIELNGGKPGSSSSGGDSYQTEVELGVSNHKSYLMYIKEMADNCKNIDVWRALLLVAYGKAMSKNELQQLMAYDTFEANRVWKALQTYIKDNFNHTPSTIFPSPTYNAV